MKQPPDVRTRLLEAARQLFARKGYEGASVRELTRKARANLGAVTYHFGSKQALYHAVFAELAEPFRRKVTAAAEAHRDALDRVEAIMRAFFAHIESHPEMAPLMLRELSSGRPVPPPMAEAMRHNVGLVVEAIVAGQREGTIRPGEPMLLALGVISQPIYLGVAAPVIRRVAGVDIRSPEMRERVIATAVEMVRSALSGGARQPSAGRSA